jgi:protein TonB
MANLPQFLARLGLTEEADERQVRRAYARELKLIDQERDLEGFQHLRACYEAALNWMAHRAARAEPAPASAAALAQGDEIVAQPDAPVADAAPQIDPVVLGEAVFTDFRARMVALAALPDRMGREESVLAAPWAAALRAALADPRLLHLYARVVFEHRIAALLADGWQPGHHLLLSAAIETFGWDEDRRALERLGHAGALVDEALEQRALFQSQDILARTQQREVLHLLRDGELPDESTLDAYAAALVTLMDYLPTLLGILAPHAAAEAWRERLTGDMLASVALTQGGKASPWERNGSSSWATGFLVLLMIRVAFMVFTHDTPQLHADQGAGGSSRLEETERRERLRNPKPIYEDEPVTAERIEAIRRLIHYRPGKDVPPGEQAVQFQVVLDADGSVLGMNKLRSPSDPAYAAAVEQAIRATGPFPPKTSKAFTLGYRTMVTHKSDVPPVTPERMAEIRRRIDYRPGKDAPPGEQRVRFEVELNEDGAIRRMKTVAMQGDPAYAEAVEQAIRSTAPFPRDTARTFVIGFHVNVARKPPADKPSDGAS